MIRGLGREIHGQCRWRWVLYSAQADVLGILATPAIGYVPWPLATMKCRPRCNSMPMIGVYQGVYYESLKKNCSHGNFSKRCAKAEAAWKGHTPHTPRVWEIKRSFGGSWNEPPPPGGGENSSPPFRDLSISMLDLLNLTRLVLTRRWKFFTPFQKFVNINVGPLKPYKTGTHKPCAKKMRKMHLVTL